MSPSSRGHRTAVFWSFAAIYIVWGSTYLAIRVLVAAVPPFMSGGARFIVAGGLLYAWARWRGTPAPDRRLWAPAALLGGLFFLVGNGGVSWAETRVPSGLAALLSATSPLFTGVFESARSGWVRPPVRVVLGIVAGLGGVTLLVTPTDLIGGGHVDLAGAAAITIASIGWAFGSVTSHAVPLHPSPVLSTAMKMLTGGALLLLLGLLRGEASHFTMAMITPQALFAWCYLIVFGSLVGFSAFTYLLRVTTPQMVSTSAFVNPLVAVFLGWAILGEAVTPRVLLAGAVIVGGVALIRLATSEPQEP